MKRRTWKIRHERVEVAENYFETHQIADGFLVGSKEQVPVIESLPGDVVLSKEEVAKVVYALVEGDQYAKTEALKLLSSATERGE
jgi:hypothetical protein